LNKEINSDKKHRKIAGLLKYFRLIMAIFYFVMGVSILFLPLFANISLSTRYALGLMLLGYGIFRFYRQIKSNDEEAN
jgi:uncharacterized membrane protein HdeD (DUF308 family)